MVIGYWLVVIEFLRPFGSKRPSAERVVIELVGDWSFEICHSAAVANSSLFTIHFSLPMAVANYSLFLRPDGSKRPKVERTFHYSLNKIHRCSAEHEILSHKLKIRLNMTLHPS